MEQNYCTGKKCTYPCCAAAVAPSARRWSGGVGGGSWVVVGVRDHLRVGPKPQKVLRAFGACGVSKK